MYSDLVNIVLPKIQAYWSQLLQVNQAIGNLTFARTCTSIWGNGVCAAVLPTETCGAITINPKYLAATQVCASSSTSGCNTLAGGPGVSGDIVIFTSAQAGASGAPCGPGSSTIAYASPCILSSNDRPVAGLLNFCPGVLTNLYGRLNGTTPQAPNSYNNLISVVVHEMTHILAYSSSLFAFYRDENGNPRTPRSSNGQPPQDSTGAYIASPNTTLITTTERGYTVQKIILPNVLARARAQFGCPTLNGVEIEHAGSSGTAGSHPTSRLWPFDYMAGALHTGASIDMNAVTLAHFQDSGWYQVNYDLAINSRFGYSAGCDFAMKPCLNTPAGTALAIPTDPNSFCNSTTGSIVCVNQRTASGVCGVFTGQTIPSLYRYFTPVYGSPTGDGMGGSDPLMDYCPFLSTAAYSSSTTGDCRFTMNSLNAQQSQALETPTWIHPLTSRGLLLSGHLSSQRNPVLGPRWI
ncbi:uncharacterized protein BJ171DRAFT_190725 [Polychytrium aggregatum]|uniref:uncharacterized protein n=1 Tax=Polychytrium aggregatum TaxID=110093 RepID=UPI0022FEEB30|nr:uncharacterized protein BJ171DRAFT_190725 [Polychytrium aggregatum]KAI9202073.1 hypothetical protein BJ171DRAFT_190725 [Polychytrium aggregatum]